MSKGSKRRPENNKKFRQNYDDIFRKKYCKDCGSIMRKMYGCGWDYDRWVCSKSGCDYEIELETISYPEEMEK